MLTHNSNIPIEWEHNKITKYPIGVQLKCHIFVYNISQNCPEQIDTYYTQEVVLRQSDFDQPEQLKTLLSESWNTPILDSGATNTVAGESWFVCYMSTIKCKIFGAKLIFINWTNQRSPTPQMINVGWSI